MTSGLLDRNLKVCAFEIDRGFASALRELFADRPHFRLIEGDVLKTWPLEAAQSLPPYLFGNLPYNIAATIIANLVEEGQIFNRIVVTVQKEVAKRMAAKPGTKDYSSFSVLCASAYTVSNLMTLKPGSFYPVPHVDSAAVLMQRRQDDLELPRLFRSLVRALFSSRRKTIKNNLDAFAASLSPGIDAQSLSIESIAAAGLKGTERAEVLGIPEFSSLARALEHTLETRRGQA
ncbi:16S rRNA (adenine(1518)-N(6)/adenine(1519)-N(6)) -dimethyltransferase RsmA [Treponema sp.]